MAFDSPGQATRETFRWVPYAIVVFVLVLAALGALWKVGVIFAKASTAAGYSITVQSQQYQQSLDDSLSQHLTNISGLATDRKGLPGNSPEQTTLRAQELNELVQFCRDALNLVDNNPGYADLHATYEANCSAGAPIAAPPLADPIPTGAS